MKKIKIYKSVINWTDTQSLNILECIDASHIFSFGYLNVSPENNVTFLFCKYWFV